MSRWYPDLPRFALLDGASPLQPLPRFGAALGGRAEIWIKREDLLPLAFGGNKLRNLEFLVGDAIAAGADVLVTEGRRWSNHCRLTAAAGARAGLAVHLVLSGPAHDPPGANQRLDALLGATVHVAASADSSDRSRLAGEVVARLRSEGRRPYRIGVGGSGLVGVVGQVLAGYELVDQAAARGMTFHTVVLPSATGGTQAGLLVGLRSAGSDARVVGVAVAHRADTLGDTVCQLLADVGRFTGCEVASREVELDDTQFGDGYGRPTAEAGEVTRLLARTEGILVDPIYTAKALAALAAHVRAGAYDGRTVVFWHAGGTPALFEELAGPSRGDERSGPTRSGQSDPATVTAEDHPGHRDPRAEVDPGVNRGATPRGRVT